VFLRTRSFNCRGYCYYERTRTCLIRDVIKDCTGRARGSEFDRVTRGTDDRDDDGDSRTFYFLFFALRKTYPRHRDHLDIYMRTIYNLNGKKYDNLIK
jgi:hypothetical protein